jgi:hypothetical protein
MFRRLSLIQIVLLAVLILFPKFSTPGRAANPSYEIDPPNTVVTSGCQAGGPCYLVVSPVPPQNCDFNTIYITLDSTGSGQAMYATAMLAQSTGRGVRVVYTQAGGSGGVCTASLVAMNN